MSVQQDEPACNFLSNSVADSRLLSSIAVQRIPHLSERNLGEIQQGESVILDLRDAEAFSAGFIPGSLNIPISDRFFGVPPGDLLRDRIIYLVAEDESAVLRFIPRIGLGARAQIRGWFLPSIVGEWQRAYGRLAELEMVAPETLAIRNSAWKTLVIDFRSQEAHDSVRIPDSICLRTIDLHKSVADLPIETRITVVCDSGQKSSFAASILFNLHYQQVSILQGGFDHYLQEDLPLYRKHASDSIQQYT